MENVEGKVSYLQGMAKGLNLDEQTTEGKMLLNMMEVLDSMAQEIQELKLAQHDLESYIEHMDTDLQQLENTVFEVEDMELLQFECPHCNAEIFFEPRQLNDDQNCACPVCGKIPTACITPAVEISSTNSANIN